MSNIFSCWRASETSCQLAPVVPALPARAQLQLRGFSSLLLCLAGDYCCCTLGVPTSRRLRGNKGISLSGCPSRTLSNFGTRQKEPMCASSGEMWVPAAQVDMPQGQGTTTLFLSMPSRGKGDPWGRQSLQLPILPLPSLAHGNSQRCSQHWLCPCCLS